MKIINREWHRQIELKENVIHTLILENKVYYREIILELLRQHKGLEGDFVLSEKNKDIAFDKNSYFITDLFNIDINNKKVLTKVYATLQKQVEEDIVEYNQLTSVIKRYFERLVFNNNLDLEQDEEIDVMSLLKLGDFKIHFEESNYLEKIIKYMKVLIDLCGVKVIFLIGLHSIFNNNEIKQFYKEICLNKIKIVNIETQQFSDYSNKDYKELIYIFDKDNCEI
ncbi:MAG: type II-A CRISPR-associated protein Csn2 [Gemella morbillorum]|uniref:type II-A CRISPR-associated protein Csn2 n=1 Tax=Gemella morbillorum TaxID=29391 RepID=UPI00254D5C8A|nr:type II-A CRISPR-associated protein Csn2 [Gemella morbillorum]MDK8239803.1 type II-A CRISPR-associated protein Csn2 [Gemella morbillorum]HET4509979.1 type II-A CRISPR-associated protein Csn2 [Streptococcus pneumoniae]